MGWPKGVPRKQTGEEMAENSEKVTIDKSELKTLMDRLTALESKKGPGIETAEQRLLKSNALSMRDPDQRKVQESIQVVDEPATIDGGYIKDKCPYCIKFHKDKPTILDVTTGGKYCCRRCGKHWFPWAIFPEDGSEGPHEYNLLMERGEKEKFEEYLKTQELKKQAKVA